MKKFIVIAVVFSFCAILGTCVKPTTPATQTRPTDVPTSTTEKPTYTVSMCDRWTWTENTLEVLEMMPDAITLDLVDALITKYDAIRAPYDCGHSELLDQIDTEVRLALAAKRTAFMVSEGKAINRNAEAEMHMIAATKALTEYTAKQ